MKEIVNNIVTNLDNKISDEYVIRDDELYSIEDYENNKSNIFFVYEAIEKKDNVKNYIDLENDITIPMYEYSGNYDFRNSFVDILVQSLDLYDEDELQSIVDIETINNVEIKLNTIEREYNIPSIFESEDDISYSRFIYLLYEQNIYDNIKNILERDLNIDIKYYTKGNKIL